MILEPRAARWRREQFTIFTAPPLTSASPSHQNTQFSRLKDSGMTRRSQDRSTERS
jgi:hypothetical protein